MELPHGELPAKRRRKRLFDLNIGEVYDLEALFDESGSEYNPGSEIDDDLENLQSTVSMNNCVIIGYVGYHVLN